jgi:hypothetical protein
MAVRYSLPKPTEPLLDQFGKLSAPWYNYLRTRYGDDAAEEIIASIEAQIADLLARVEALEEGESARIVGPQSVSVVGSLQNGLVQLTLVNDEALPLPVSFYATDENQEKGWQLLQPDWVPNPYADYLVDENGDYLIDENGNFLTSDDGFPINPDYLPDHNNLNGLDGGTAGEYYHLTAAEHTAAQGLAGVSPTDGIFSANLRYSVTPFQIVATTTDGADTSRSALSGGGAVGASRGGYVICFGNESATNPGQVQVISGNGADIIFSGGTLRSSLDNTYDFGASSMRYANGYIRALRPGAGTVIWTSGTGTPEGVVVAPVGSLFTRTDGGAGTTLYCKESGAGNTGWVAK